MLTMTKIRGDGLVTVHRAQEKVIPLRFWVGRDDPKKPWGPCGDTPFIEWVLVQHWTIGASEALPYAKALEQKMYAANKGV